MWAANIGRTRPGAKAFSLRATSTQALLSEFNDVFDERLPGKLPGKHHITIRSDVCPCVHACRRVPLALLPKVKEKLETMERNGIIVKRDEPTAWVNSMLVVEKKDGSIRLCIDPRELNKAIMREHYQVPTFDDVLPRLAGKKLFSIIDMKDGFWHIELDEESSKLVTFNTPFGRYSFTRLPFGISSAPEVFQKRAQQTFGDIEGVNIVFDDIIIAASSMADHDKTLRQLLERARTANVRFNRAKLQLLVQKVSYLGHLVSQEGISPDPEKVRAITNFPPPGSREDLLRFNGMATYVSRYIQNFADTTYAYRQLLKKDAPWNWAEPQQSAFAKIKQQIASAPVLSHYDPSKQLVIQTDASSKGIGSCLMQEDHPICFASRALTDCETRYAQIEKELMAIVFACERFNTYVYGRSIIVQSDHKPLEAIFKKPIASTTPRLQRMLLRLGRYQLHVKYTPGKEMHIADALSRAYMQDARSPAEEELAEDLDVAVHTVLFRMPLSNAGIKEIRAATASDPVLTKIRGFLTDGMPVNSNGLPTNLKAYRQILPELYETEGIIFKDRRMVIPASKQEELVKKLHASHMGIEKTKQLARQHYYWPGIDQDIESYVRRCSTCCQNRRRQPKQPLLPHPVPEYPWQKVGCDIFTFRGRDYLLVVDYFSKCMEIEKLKAKSAAGVMNKLQLIFSRYGVPETLVADNMPCASAEFLRFARTWNFQIVTSSPNYPQSNGQAERAIQTAKKLMKKAHESGQNIHRAFLHLRATPIANTNLSPAQLLFGRSLRTDLPSMPPTNLTTNINWREQLVRKQSMEKQHADKGSVDLPRLIPGETVRIHHGDQLILGRVLEELPEPPRSYRVISTDGYEYRRNRRDLIRTFEPTPNIIPSAFKIDPAKNKTQQRPADERPAEIAQQTANRQEEQLMGNNPEPVETSPAPQTTSEAPPPRTPPRRSTRVRKAPMRYSP